MKKGELDPFDELINPSLERFKSELQYDAKVWLDERESDAALKGPFDLMIAFALICAEHAVDVLLLLRDLKSVVGLGRASSSKRLRICFCLYALSAVHRRLRNLPDDEWNGWPVTSESHCFEIHKLSTLSALDVFCEEVEIASFEWIFRWVWNITGRPVDCDPVLCVIRDVIKEAGILNFIEWSHKFNLNIFTDSELFPGSEDVRFPEIISDECNLETELDRVVLELQHEHYKAKADLQSKDLLGSVHKMGRKGKKRRGRPKITGLEEKKREEIVAGAARARESGVPLSQYLEDLNEKGIEIEGKKYSCKISETNFKTYQSMFRKRKERQKSVEHNATK